MEPTPLFRTILCPIDFSAHSRRALAYAALLAARVSGKLIVIFVEDPLLAAAGGTRSSAVTSAQLQRTVTQTIRSYALDRGQVEVKMLIGTPAVEIIKTAKHAGCDLIVLGAHGLTGLNKVFLGSTTERLLRTAAIPVLGIPPAHRGTRFPKSRWPEACAIIPVELDRQSTHSATVAAVVAASLGTTACLVHALPRRDHTRLATTRARLTRLQRSAGSNVVSSHVLMGTPADQIATIATDSATDLVIITRKPAGGLFGTRIGTISYQLICDVKTPVLALPSTDAWLRRARKRSVHA